MRPLLILLLVVVACNSPEQPADQSPSTDLPPVYKPADTPAVKDPADTLSTGNDTTNRNTDERPVYSNKRFREVRVQRLGGNRFLITGQGQIFEASFGWYVEDGHEELKSGHNMTDAGAPEWGNFSFTVRIKKKRENSKLHLVLFEASAEDGSRQHELPVLLY